MLTLTGSTNDKPILGKETGIFNNSTRFYEYNIPWYKCDSNKTYFDYRKYIKEVKVTGQITFNANTKLQGLFDGCVNVVTIDISEIDGSNVNNIRNLFRNCYKLSLVNINQLNIRTEVLDGVFTNTPNLIQITTPSSTLTTQFKDLLYYRLLNWISQSQTTVTNTNDIQPNTMYIKPNIINTNWGTCSCQINNIYHTLTISGGKGLSVASNMTNSGYSVFVSYNYPWFWEACNLQKSILLVIFNLIKIVN